VGLGESLAPGPAIPPRTKEKAASTARERVGSTTDPFPRPASNTSKGGGEGEGRGVVRSIRRQSNLYVGRSAGRKRKDSAAAVRGNLPGACRPALRSGP